MKDEHGAANRKLFTGVTLGSKDVVIEALEEGADINFIREDGSTVLAKAISQGNFDLFKLLFEKGIDPNEDVIPGVPALLFACGLGRYSTIVVSELIKCGADVNCSSSEGFNPICAAAELNRLDLAEILLENGADVDSRSIGGGTPLMLAARDGHIEMIRLLLSKGADLFALTDAGSDAIDFAKLGGHPEAAQMLNRIIDEDRRKVNRRMGR